MTATAGYGAWRRVVLMTALVSLGLVVLVAAPVRPAIAAAFSAAFVVADLPVDATGKSGVAARDAARDAGEKQALQLLLQRLTAPTDWPRLPSLSADDITDLVLDFEVESEHVSASHYIGCYTFRFDPKGIRDLLQQANIPFTELVSKRVVVAPVFQNAAGTHLWDDPNPWRDAWNAAHGPAGLVPWIVPAGDLDDVQSLDVPDVQHPNMDKLVTLSQRYGGGDVVIATAIEQDTPADPSSGTLGTASLQITVTRYSDTGTYNETTSVTGEKPDAAFYLSGVMAAERALEDLWKKLSLTPAATPGTGVASTPVAPGGNALTPSSTGMLVPPGSSQEIEVLVPISSPQDWIQARDKITQVSGVLGSQIEVLTKNGVLLRLTLSSEPETLALAFAQQDLALVPGTKGGPMLLQAASSANTPTLNAPTSAPAQTLAPLPAQTLGAEAEPPATPTPNAAPVDQSIPENSPPAQ